MPDRSRGMLASAAMLVLVLVALVVWLGPGGAGETSGARAEQGEAHTVLPTPLPSPEVRGDAEPLQAEPIEGGAAAEAALAPALAPGRAALRVSVRWARDGEPAPGVLVQEWTWGDGDPIGGARVATTDERGVAEFLDLRPGHAVVDADRGGYATGLLTGGETLELEVVVPEGLLVDGLVVDGEQRPVPGAGIWLSVSGNSYEGVVMDRSDGRGRFQIRDVASHHSLSARHPAHAPSSQVTVEGEPGETVPVTLELGGEAGDVAVQVVDVDGSPLEDAEVELGGPRGFPSTQPFRGRHVSGPPPFTGVTDAEGQFAVPGVPLGKTRVAARKRGFAAISEPLTVTAGAPVETRLVLPVEAVVQGTVRDVDARPVSYASVLTGEYGTFTAVHVISGVDGHYRLGGLAPGTADLLAEQLDGGKARTTLTLEAGQTVAWDPVLGLGLRVRGRVVDEAGEPRAHWGIQATRTGQPQGREDTWYGSGSADEQGRFTIGNCADVGHELAFDDDWTSVAAFTAHDVHPGDDEQVFVVPDQTLASAVVAGRVVDDTGQPVGGAELYFSRADERNGRRLARTGPDGTFRSDPVPPDTWRVSLYADSFAPQDLPPLELAPGELRDLGTVVLDAPGFVVVHVSRAKLAPGAPPPSVGLEDLEGVTLGLAVEDEDSPPGMSSRRSGPLAEGDYRVRLGQTVGAQVVPVHVDSGQETHVETEPSPGVEVTFRVSSREPLQEALELRLRIRDPSGVTLERRGFTGSHLDVWKPRVLLLPGEYVLAFGPRDGPLREQPLTVGEAPGPPVQLVLP